MLTIRKDPLTPAAIFATFGAVALSFQLYDSIQLISVSSALALAMIAITVSDIRHYLIPDWISLPLIPAGIIYTAYTAPTHVWIELTLISAVSAFFGFGLLYLLRSIYRKFRNRNGLGLGDVKLAAVAGAWTELAGLNMVLLLASISAIAVILLIHLSGHKIKATTAIPFGAFLAPAIWVTWSLQQTGVTKGFLL